MKKYQFLEHDKAVIPWMEKPDCYFSTAYPDHSCAKCVTYHNHLKTATRISLSSIPSNWVDGMIVKESDLRFQHELFGPINEDEWHPCSKEIYEQETELPKRIIAHPIEAAGEQVEETFEDYIRNTRAEFIDKVAEQEWNTELRTAAENILLCFDQMRKRLESATHPPVKEEDVQEAAKEYANNFIKMNGINEKDNPQLAMDLYEAFKTGASWQASHQSSAEAVGKDAVGFLNWVAKEDYKPGTQNEYWYKWLGMDCTEQPFTTEQLYQLYKTQTQNH